MFRVEGLGPQSSSKSAQLAEGDGAARGGTQDWDAQQTTRPLPFRVLGFRGLGFST